jgi:hypothetical protein
MRLDSSNLRSPVTHVKAKAAAAGRRLRPLRSKSALREVRYLEGV